MLKCSLSSLLAKIMQIECNYFHACTKSYAENISRSRTIHYFCKKCEDKLRLGIKNERVHFILSRLHYLCGE